MEPLIKLITDVAMAGVTHDEFAAEADNYLGSVTHFNNGRDGRTRVGTLTSVGDGRAEVRDIRGHRWSLTFGQILRVYLPDVNLPTNEFRHELNCLRRRVANVLGGGDKAQAVDIKNHAGISGHVANARLASVTPMTCGGLFIDLTPEHLE